jgi:hypothetical protein
VNPRCGGSPVLCLAGGLAGPGHVEDGFAEDFAGGGQACDAPCLGRTCQESLPASNQYCPIQLAGGLTGG